MSKDEKMKIHLELLSIISTTKDIMKEMKDV